MNLIKTFRQQKHRLYSHGAFVGYMNKWVDGTFGPVIGWTVYSASGDLIAHVKNPQEAWDKLFASIADRDRLVAGPY